MIETTLSSISTTVNSRAIENHPVKGHNYLDFATLTPGVVRDQNREGDLSVGGQKGTLNSLFNANYSYKRNDQASFDSGRL